VDLFLEQADVTSGERAFLAALRASSMRIYEVVEVVPGTSLTLRDVVEGGQVTVHERSGSRSIGRHEWIAARVVPRGPSGGPEIEAGLLHIPRMFTESVLAQVRQQRAAFLSEHPGADIAAFYKTMPPFFHDVWAGSMLEPAVPDLRNTDGEEMVFTHVHFELVEPDVLSRALEGHAELEADGKGSWSWSGKNAKGADVSLGHIKLGKGGLVLEANSVERGERGRALFESVAGGAIRHRATTHENIRRAVQERVRTQALGGEIDKGEDRRPAEIPMAAQEALVLGHLGQHYRAWVDEPVPALDDHTPRQAAADPKLRSRVVDLIHGLEGIYQQALRDRQPAYDPSWMWSDLGLVDRASPLHPPPLAHERVAERVPGSAEVSRAVAERLRRAPGFSDAASVLSAGDFDADLELQRFLREHKGAANESGTEGSVAAPYLRRMVNFDLHRRKAFRVDEALSYMLGQTDLDVVGRELRVPFASFALVFTDRHVLSMAERELAMEDDCPLSGQILRVATVYVTEERRGDKRQLDVCFALDALGADLPVLLRHEIPLEDEVPVQSYLDAVAPLPLIEPQPADASPLRGLLRTTVNAILYATSAGVEPERRGPPTVKKDKKSRVAPAVFCSDEVYFLPGVIDITSVRRMQELERAPDGREILKRYMVRGHWRRAQKGWTDQRLRWIEPYWKGPDMAAVIERTYRLKE
jgi:hypothetical protein